MVDRKTKQDADTNLRVLIELSKGINKKFPWIKYPSSVIFEIRDIYDGRKKKAFYIISHLLNVFGLTPEESKDKEKVCIRVKSLMN